MPQRNSRPGRRALPIVMVAAAGLLAAACHSSSQYGTAGSTTSKNKNSSGSGGQAQQVHLAISPAAGSRSADPAKGITVTATDGKISSVHVAGAQVTGTMSKSGTSWHSDWTLPVGKKLTVTATATGPSGHTVTDVSSFRTLTPAQTFTTMIFEGYQQTYGVGMPIMLSFNRPIVNRAAVERAMTIKTSKPVVGAWYWDGDKTLVFRPRTYWPAHTTVSFIGHLNGLEEAPGVYGTYTLTQTFTIGQSLIVVASTKTHHLKLYRNGKQIAYWPISTGRPGDDTPNGTYLTIDKHNPELMVGPGYRLEVPWSVRFTWTGDYLHDAYWSVGEQGYINVSHGCVNMRPADAKYYYQMAVPGDPVTVVGSPLPGTWDNGWTEWFLSWPQLVKGSALHMAVQAGPNGSQFVSPATLTAATATAPLGTSRPGNSRAG
ncbi:MAG: L,D-transpeptidase [Streptosporangiaceae bacterium]